MDVANLSDLGATNFPVVNNKNKQKQNRTGERTTSDTQNIT